MKPKRKAHIKPGQNVQATAHRHRSFVDVYITNGRNATQAALSAGYSPRTAACQAQQLLARPHIRTMIDKRLAELDAKMIITTERTLREVARIAYFDPRKLFDKRGQLLPIHKLDDDTAAAIASMEVAELIEERDSVGVLKKIKHWDKNAALEKAMKYLGLFERDNAQRDRAPIDVTVKLVRSKPRTIEGNATVIEARTKVLGATLA